MVIDILHARTNFQIIGITSNSKPSGEFFAGFRILGDDSILSEYDPKTVQIAMGIGGFKTNSIREKAYSYIKSLGFTFVNVIHPTAIISRTCKLGEGIVIFPGVTLNTEVIIGNNTIIATGSTVDHETVIGNNVLVSAGVTIGANSKIHDNSLIALGAKIVSGVDIGENVVVAAGAVVINDIGDNEIVYGIPANSKKKTNEE